MIAFGKAYEAAIDDGNQACRELRASLIVARADIEAEKRRTRAAIDSRDQADQEAAALRADVVTLLAKIEDGHREVRCLQRELSGALQLLQEAQNANRELETRLDEARTIAVRGRG